MYTTEFNGYIIFPQIEQNTKIIKMLQKYIA